MLASLLPGLRDLRTPLSVGYVWLLVLWLLIHDRLPRHIADATGTLRSFYELGGFLGPGVVLAAISFVAYLVGSILLSKFDSYLHGGNQLSTFSRLRDYWNIIYGMFTVFLAGPFRAPRMSRFASIRLLQRPIYEQLTTFVEATLREATPDLIREEHLEVVRSMVSIHDIERYQKHPDIYSTHRIYVDAVIEGLPAVGIQLQAKNRDLWDTYDRQSAEAQFRFGISPPLMFAICIIAFQSSIWWLLLISVPMVLVLQGRRQLVDRTSTLVQAIVLKIVEPPVFERLRETLAKKEAWLTQSLARSKEEEREHRGTQSLRSLGLKRPDS